MHGGCRWAGGSTIDHGWRPQRRGQQGHVPLQQRAPWLRCRTHSQGRGTSCLPSLPGQCLVTVIAWLSGTAVGPTWGQRPQRGQVQEQHLRWGSQGWKSHRRWLGSSGSVSPSASNICSCTSHPCSSAPVLLTLRVPHSPGGLHKLRVSAGCGGCCRQTCWLPASYLRLEIGFLYSPACSSNANVACDVHLHSSGKAESSFGQT